MLSTTGGPIVRLDTKCPSIISTWRSLAPPRSARAISSARRAKSADSIEGTISIICGLFKFYHGGVETVPGIASGKPHQRRRAGNLLILLRFQGTRGIHHQSARREERTGIREKGHLPPVQIVQIGRCQSPLNLRVARECTGARAGCVDENPVEGTGEG